MAPLDRNTLTPIFEPRSIAIIGASTDPRKEGGQPVKFMRERAFDGRIFPVNPNADEVQGLPAFGAIGDIEDEVDVALIAVPAKFVPGAMEEAIAKGVKGIVIFSSGFAEIGGDGAKTQARMRDMVREAGVRLLGPNCMGVFSVRPNFYCTFGTAFYHYGGKGWPKPGNTALIGQSGSVGMHMFAVLRDRGVGLTSWVTTGNQADVEVADCIAYFADDPATEVIVAYIEGVHDRDKLIYGLDRARQNGKPVIILKVGASEIGVQAALSHTASHAGSDAVYDALFRQYGAYRAADMYDMADAAYAAAHKWMPARAEAGIVSISGGVAILMSDVAHRLGVDIPELPDISKDKIRSWVPNASTRNPVDLTAAWVHDLALMANTADTMFSDADIAAAIVYLSSVGLDPNFAARVLAELGPIAAKHPDRRLAVSTRAGAEATANFEQAGILVFDDPGRAVRTIAAMGRIRAGLDSATAGDPLPTLPAEAEAPSHSLTGDAARHALAAAGVELGAEPADGLAVRLAIETDATMGPVVRFGLGGELAALYDDTALRIAPIGPGEARRMIGEVKGSALLAECDVIADALSRLSVYADAHRDRIDSIAIDGIAGAGGLAAKDIEIAVR